MNRLKLEQIHPGKLQQPKVQIAINTRQIDGATWCLRSISSPKRNSMLGASSTMKEQG
jgi:hypothetical protein